MTTFELCYFIWFGPWIHHWREVYVIVSLYSHDYHRCTN